MIPSPALVRRSFPGAFLLLVASLAAMTPGATASPPDPFEQASLNVRTYFDTDGLPQNSVESLSVDRDGRLWVTTRDGGAVFDGTAWTPVPMPDPAGSNWPRNVLSTGDGAVWFSVERVGLHRYSDGVWRTWSTQNGLQGTVQALLEDDGTLLVGTTAGIYAIRLSAQSIVMELGEGDVVALARSDKRTLALTADGTVLERGERSWSAIPEMRITDANPVSLFITDEKVLVGTDSGIVTFDGSERRVDAVGVPVKALARTTLPNRAEILWAGTEGGGLLALRDGVWTPVAPGIRVPNRYLYDLLATPSSGQSVHLLVGTLSGIARIDLAAWRHIGTDDGLPESSVVSILESRVVKPGTYLLGTTGGLATFGASGKWELTDCEDLQAIGVFSIFESSASETIYFGTDSGVVAMDRSGCRRMPGLDGVSVAALVESGREPSRLWIGTFGEGLWYLDDQGLSRQSGVQMPEDHIEALAVTGEDLETLWIATNDGLARLSGGTLRVFDQSSGLPNDLVRSILVDDHRMWVGTARGLAHADLGTDPPTWTKFDLRADDRMENDTVYRIEKDPAGHLYAFTGRGIARLGLDEAGGHYRLERVFLSDDGLPSSETNFGASLVDSSGRIWAGTPLGAGILDPSLESRSASKSHRLAVSLESDPEGAPIHDGDVLTADVDRIVASFRLIDLVHGHRAVYRTELTGLDEGHGQWTSSAQRVFSKLPGGRYELRVWARDPHGHEAGPEVVTFSVQQPAWLSWWAVLIYVAGAVIALYTAVGLRIRSLRRRNRELELIVRSRTRDLEVANRQLESANVTLADMSVTDPLTGARNRRYLLQRMEQEAVRVRRSTREADDIVFLLVDIDRFKYVNDRFGHATGDHVLKQFHAVLVHAIRDTDTIVRWGGEEFLVVARRISRSEATILAQRILQMVREKHFESTDSTRHMRLTCSIGFATFPFVTWDRSLFTWEQVVDIADHCLYAAKRSGRDGWVSLAAAPQLRSDSFLSRMRDDVESLATTDEVTVVTSFENPSDLSWR